MIFIINCIVFFVLGSFLIINFKQYINIKRSLSYLLVESKKALSSKNLKRLIILIPVMEEESIVESTLLYFKWLLEQHPDSRLIFITTQKEGAPEQNMTYQKIVGYISNKLLLEHYPFTFGNKAHQINYAVSKLGNQFNDGILTYYAIFDADSRPDPRGLHYVSQDNEQEIIYQMPPVYSSNLNQLSLLGKAAAIFQTRWMMSHELPALLQNYQQQQAKNLSYCIGHGLFIRKDYLEDKQFPQNTVTEDLLFGYLAVRNKVYAKPVPYFDYCSSACRFVVGIRQSARWHSGDLSSLISLIYTDVRCKNKQYCWLQIKRLFHMLQWPFGTLLSLLTAFWSIYLQNWLELILIILLSCFYVLALHAPILRLFFSQATILFYIYWALFIKSITNCFGPLYSYYLRLNPKLNLWFKTPRK